MWVDAEDSLELYFLAEVVFLLKMWSNRTPGNGSFTVPFLGVFACISFFTAVFYTLSPMLP